MVFDLDAEKINPLMELSPPDCEPTLLSLRVKAPSVFTFNVRKARLTLPEISGNPAPLCAPATKLSPGAQFRKNLWPLRNLRPELDFWRCQQSFRNWAPGKGTVPGVWITDTGRNATGTIGSLDTYATATGVFFSDGVSGTAVGSADRSIKKMDLSRQWAEHTGKEFAPVHIWQPPCLYLGRPA